MGWGKGENFAHSVLHWGLYAYCGGYAFFVPRDNSSHDGPLLALAQNAVVARGLCGIKVNLERSGHQHISDMTQDFVEGEELVSVEAHDKLCYDVYQGKREGLRAREVLLKCVKSGNGLAWRFVGCGLGVVMAEGISFFLGWTMLGLVEGGQVYCSLGKAYVGRYCCTKLQENGMLAICALCIWSSSGRSVEVGLQ